MVSSRLFALLFVGLVAVAAVSAAGSGTQKVKLSQVQALTLHANQMTTARRGYPIPQLTCVGDRNLCNPRYKPTVVQCYNVGSDGNDVQWRCEAELDSDVAFDNIDVSCEGYYAPEDEYILQGSCGLKYSLKYTNAYRDKQNQQIPRATGRPSYTNPTYVDETESQGGGFKFFLLACAAILFIIWCTRPRREVPIQTAPPVDDFLNRGGFMPAPANQQSSGPGFGAGVVVGAMGGAAAAHLLNRQNRPEPLYPSLNTHDQSHSRHSPPSSPKERTATGFGSTSRR